MRLNYRTCFFQPALFVLAFVSLMSSCMMQVHSVDRAVMLEEDQREVMVYAGANAGGSFSPEFNVGLGGAMRFGQKDYFTFGISGDANFNSSQASWAKNIFYGQFSVDQKFSLVKDILAVKLKQGVFISNYYGLIDWNSNSASLERERAEPLVPFISTAFYISPEGRFDTKKWHINFGLNGYLGIRDGVLPWSAGATVGFDHSKDRNVFLSGFEAGAGIQRIIPGGGAVYISLGLFFSKFKKSSPRPPLEY